MAHRLLTNVFWAGIEYGPGLPAGDQIPGLSLSDEAALVSSNRAVYTSPPPVINNGLPVLWVPNPDGGITKFMPLTVSELSGSGELGVIYTLADGPDAGAKLTWAVPSGSTSPTWCWWLWPQAAYEI